ncbi:MAG: Eco57I restriction-modification methylase domain-containing protein [Candidatus Micrarchaeaceae archaeon]
MNSEIKKVIEKGLKSYTQKPIKISDKEYTLYIFSEDEDLNLFEGFLFSELKDKSEVSYLISRYRVPVSGYVPRISLLFYGNQLLIKDYRRGKCIRKTLGKINRPFISKIEKALSEPNETNFNKLFDRTDIIEEFYILYKKARDYLLKNIKGISGEERREEFVDNFMMQMLTLWYLQEKGFFNNDTSYLITKFKELKQKKLFNGFNNYYEFLTYFFDKICNQFDSQYYQDSIVGKVVVVGPAIFLNGERDSKAISIPDKCFYKEGMTEILISTQPKKVSDEVPLLNLFESKDWTEGNIDEFVLGAIYEKLITYIERKKLGAYYTPEEITSYISKNTIEPYLIDRVNEKFREKFESIDQIIERGNKEILIYFFWQLKEIKICDPAVGSAHFLESAINVLVNIYEKLWDKAKEIGLRKGLEILTADEKGNIKTINLLEISDEEQFKLYVKFFIILSKNIYGVDINPSALKVAKARLFLTLAKHFDVDKNYFIRFPNMHFNLRDGNSLIGYAQLKIEKEEKGQLTLDLFVKEKETTYITETIKVISKLKEYLIETTNALGINGNIVREIEELNKILSKKKINWDEFETVMRTKEKLIRILIASLNSQYARPLNELLNTITQLFNNKLDEKFAQEHNIDLAELKKIKTFHWIFEFPEVFLDRGGFDVVVGNPPYGNILSDIEKNISKIYASFIDEIASVFVERSIPLNKNKGYLCFIITYAITFSKNLSITRKVIYENYEECIITTFDRDKCRFFDNMTQSVSIMLCKRKNPTARCKFYSSRMFRVMPELTKIDYQEANDYLLGDKFGVKFLDSHRLPKIGDKLTLDVLKKITVNKNNIGNLLSSKYKKNEKIFIRTSGNYWYNAWDREPYQNTKIMYLMVSDLFKDFLILLINSSTYYLWFRIYGDGRDMNTDIMLLVPVPAEKKIISSNKFLSHISNLLMKFLFYNFDRRHTRFNTSNVKPVIDICDVILGRLYGLKKDEIEHILSYENEIRGGKRIPDLFYSVIDYLLFDCQTNKNYFDYGIVDSLVYELYLKENHLLQLVSKHLKPINYDRWAELYWKKQLEGKLKPDEEKELEKLDKENLTIIQDVCQKLSEDKDIQKQIEKIKSHSWVKIIEGKT